jgi:3-phosphoshikimate 1-carboxyvinyltransferase
MANIIIEKTNRLVGTINAPSSKAYTHRAVIAASLSEGKSIINYASNCEDARVTIRACSMLGAEIDKENTILVVKGNSKPKTAENIIYCRGSGSTIRFMSSVCALADGVSVLSGNRSLKKRPMQQLLNGLKQLGVQCFSIKNDGTPPLIIFGGGLKGGEASLVGNISSQFISSLLLSTPKAQNETKIKVTTELASKPYVMMTVDVLRKHNLKIDCSSNYDRFYVPCEQEYHCADHSIEGDYSSAAFILAAAAITKSNVKVKRLPSVTLQGDRIIINILRTMGVKVNSGDDYVEVINVDRKLSGFNINLNDAPDLVPICAVLASFAQGETTIKGVSRLRFKESDRIASLTSELTKMGSNIIATKDSLIIQGKSKLQGANIYSHNDHRIAMACSIAALGAEGKTKINGSDCIKKSYPNFVYDLRFLGGKIFGR